MTTVSSAIFTVLITISSLSYGQWNSNDIIGYTGGGKVDHLGPDTSNTFQARSIFRDSRGNLWFATNGDGVFRYDGRTIIRYTDKHGLCGNYAWMIQEGHDGALWFRTRDGISRFDGRTFTNYTNRQLQDNSEPGQWNIAPGDLWFDAGGGRGGVYRYRSGKFAWLPLPRWARDTISARMPNSSYSPYAVYCILLDRKGGLWFGTQEMGVCHYDGSSFSWLPADGLRGAAVRTIFEDRDGAIWIGNNGNGLFRYDGKTVMSVAEIVGSTRPKKPQSLPMRVWTVADDKAGNLWIGTIDAGVWRYDGKAMTRYTVDNGLDIDFIWTIVRDRLDNLWFGTDGGGVQTFDGTRFRRFRPSRH